MAYPNTLDTFTDVVDGVDHVMAAHVNGPHDAIEAIETELGTLPKGSFADVKTHISTIWYRMTGAVVVTPTDHFTGGVIPTGYAWDAAAPFAGTPTYVSYNAGGHWMSSYHGAATKCFLRKAITNSAAAWQNLSIWCRANVGATTEAGLRVDDGTDNNYAEMYLSGALADGRSQLYFRYRAGAGVTTTASNIIIPTYQEMTLRLYCAYAAPNYTIFGYLSGPYGGAIAVTGFSTGVIGWAPAAGRAGLLLAAAGGGAAWDWFHNTFA